MKRFYAAALDKNLNVYFCMRTSKRILNEQEQFNFLPADELLDDLKFFVSIEKERKRTLYRLIKSIREPREDYVLLTYDIRPEKLLHDKKGEIEKIKRRIDGLRSFLEDAV